MFEAFGSTVGHDTLKYHTVSDAWRIGGKGTCALHTLSVTFNSTRTYLVAALSSSWIHNNEIFTFPSCLDPYICTYIYQVKDFKIYYPPPIIYLRQYCMIIWLQSALLHGMMIGEHLQGAVYCSRIVDSQNYQIARACRNQTSIISMNIVCCTNL